jgi:hypothetical protein
LKTGRASTAQRDSCAALREENASRCKSYDDLDDVLDDVDVDTEEEEYDDDDDDDDAWWTNGTTTTTTTDAHGCDSRPERGHVGYRTTGGRRFVTTGDASGTNGRRWGDDAW